MNTVKSFRVLTGLNQKEMSEKLNMSEGHYRAKEKGKYLFNQNEMELFLLEVRKVNSNISYEDIFFSQKPT